MSNPSLRPLVKLGNLSQLTEIGKVSLHFIDYTGQGASHVVTDLALICVTTKSLGHICEQVQLVVFRLRVPSLNLFVLETS